MNHFIWAWLRRSYLVSFLSPQKVQIARLLVYRSVCTQCEIKYGPCSMVHASYDMNHIIWTIWSPPYDQYQIFHIRSVKMFNGINKSRSSRMIQTVKYIWRRHIEDTVCLLALGAFKSRIEKVKIKGFAPAHCISLSSGAWVANILNQEFCLSLLAN